MPSFVTNTPEFLVNTAGTNAQVSPHATGLQGGGYVIVWQTNDFGDDGSHSAIKAQLYGADGAPVGGEFRVNTATEAAQTQPYVAPLNDGGFVVTWHTMDPAADGDGSAIKAQRYDAAGAPNGAEFLVNTEDAGNQRDPSVTQLTSGELVFSWTTEDTGADLSGEAVMARIFDVGMVGGNDFVINSMFMEDQHRPDVAALADGRFVAVWETAFEGDDGSGSAIKVKSFNADGTVHTVEELVNFAAVDDNQRDPQVVGLAGGGFVVTWVTEDETEDSSGSAIMAQIYDDTYTALGADFRVNANFQSNQDQPTVTALADGRFAISWRTEDPAQDGDLGAIKAQVYQADGTPSGHAFVMNSQGAGMQSTPVIAGGANGDLLAAWVTSDASQDGDGSAIKAQMLQNVTLPQISLDVASVSETSIQGLTVGRLMTDAVNEDSFGFSIINDPSGAFVIVKGRLIIQDGKQLDFETLPQVTLTIEIDDGEGNTAQQQVFVNITDVPGIEHRYAAGAEATVNMDTVDEQTWPSIAALADGGYVIAWETDDIAADGSGSAIKMQMFNADGSPNGFETLVNTAAEAKQIFPKVAALTGGGFVVGWTTKDSNADGDSTAVKAQIFDAGGVAQGAELLLNADAVGAQYLDDIDGLPDGGFVATWTSHDSAQDGEASAIKAAQFDASGAMVGAEFVANTAGASGQMYSTVAALDGGGFVATWSTWDTSQDGSESAIKAQIFDAGGAKQGGEVLVNTTSEGAQMISNVTGLPGGGFAVAWISETAVKAQVFDGSGGKIGTEIAVSGPGASEQTFLAIEATPDGRFAVMWRNDADTLDTTGGAINAQTFDASGTKLGTSFLVNSATNDTPTDPALAVLTDGTLATAWTTRDGAQDGDQSAIQSRLFTLIANTAPTALQLAGETSVAENSALGTVIAGVKFEDADPVDSHHMTLVDDAGGRFALQGGDLAVAGPLDFEAAQAHQVTVRVTDNGGLSTDQMFEITVGDVAEDFGGSEEANEIQGDAADNAVSGAGGDDTVSGGAGMDTVDGGDGDDMVSGDDGDDLLIGGPGNDTLDGGAGNDRAHAGNGNDSVIGGTGDDTLHGDNEEDYVDGGEGNDLLTGGRGDDTVEGGSGDDALWGWLGLDSLIGGEGDDFLVGEEDSDTLEGGHGNDTAYGGQGWDVIHGGDGNDSLMGDTENDTIHGGDGDDTVEGGFDEDLLYGDDGNDELWGWLGDDILEGGKGDDLVFGEEGNDVVSGGEGNDLLVGGTGNDTLWGHEGNDTLDGGAGDDLLIAEAGADVFLFFDGFGSDTAQGFEVGLDVIDLAGVSTVSDFADLAANHLSQDGADAVIDTGVGALRLEGINIADLDAMDFIF